jgi:hypothetical protein
LLLLKPVAGAGDGGGFLFSPTTATPGSQPQPGEGQRFAAAPAAGVVASSSPSSSQVAATAGSAAAPSPLAGMLESIVRSCGPLTPGACDWRRLATVALARHASSRYLTPSAASVLFAGCASPLQPPSQPPAHESSRRRERES